MRRLNATAERWSVTPGRSGKAGKSRKNATFRPGHPVIALVAAMLLVLLMSPLSSAATVFSPQTQLTAATVDNQQVFPQIALDSNGKSHITWFGPHPTAGGAQQVWYADNTSGAWSTTRLTATTWYLAEGTNAWGFSTYITIENPQNEQLTAHLIYMDPNPSSGAGVVGTRDVTLPPLSQTTVSSYDDIGPVDFSTKVEC